MSEIGRHRVELRFDDGVYAKLICPESGCAGSEICGHCGRYVTDTETAPCYDCAGADPAECWVKTWFDNCSAEELLHGTLTVEITAEWDGDAMRAHVVRAVDAERRRLTFREAGTRPGRLEEALAADHERRLEAYERWCDEREAEEDRIERQQAKWLSDVGDEDAAA